MDAVTFERVDLKAKFASVNYNLVRRSANIDSIRFELFHNGREIRINSIGLASIIGQDNVNKVLSTSGKIAICQNILITILED